MEREEHVMNYDLDHMRCIRMRLAELSCEGCRRQGLVLLLRYSSHKGRCLFLGFCKACQRKKPIDLEDTHP